MAYQHKDGRGSTFYNDKKQAPTHADYKGDGKIGGVDYWINTWIARDDNGNVKLDDNGKPRFQHSFKPKEAKQEQRQTAAYVDDGDDIPF